MSSVGAQVVCSRYALKVSRRLSWLTVGLRKCAYPNHANKITTLTTLDGDAVWALRFVAPSGPQVRLHVAGGTGISRVPSVLWSTSDSESRFRLTMTTGCASGACVSVDRHRFINVQSLHGAADEGRPIRSVT